MVIDYSQTINRYTLLDAYPLPKIDEMINKMAQYNGVYSSVDFTSAYYQIPLNPEDRPYTAYEAGGKLYQFTRLRQGVTNGVSSFQRKMDGFIDDNIKDTFSYLDNVHVCGRTLEEHNANLAKFKAVAIENNLTINENKSIYGVRPINVIGYHIENGTVSPDLDRLRPLLQLPIPHDTKSLRRVIGMFAYYSKWIKQFSDNIRTLNKAETFPLPDNAISAFNELKQELANVTLMSIDENIPFLLRLMHLIFRYLRLQIKMVALLLFILEHYKVVNFLIRLLKRKLKLYLKPLNIGKTFCLVNILLLLLIRSLYLLCLISRIMEKLKMTKY